jgi:hypothetical protein
VELKEHLGKMSSKSVAAENLNKDVDIKGVGKVSERISKHQLKRV